MTRATRLLRADARRNRDRILDAAGALFAQRAGAVQMDEIAERAGLGMGTLYRHFPTKQALLGAIVARRFSAMAELARAAEEIEDPGQAFETLLTTYLAAARSDAAYRYVLLGPDKPAWADVAEQKAEFSAIAERVLARAATAGRVRDDLTFADFILITRGVMSNMSEEEDWRRHLALTLDGIRAPAGRQR